ncbi:MAG: hypothetical protein PHQ36_08205 [Anaerolineales bacterium]|nr:hypothetical protein [Anaerolineales bacterium]
MMGAVLVLLLLLIWRFGVLQDGYVAILNQRPDYRLKIDQETQKEFRDEATKNNIKLSKAIIWLTRARKETTEGAGVKGRTFVYGEWMGNMPILKIYLDANIYNSLDKETADESLGYFLIRQVLLRSGLSDKKVNNAFSYKYGISTPKLFTITPIR